MSKNLEDLKAIHRKALIQEALGGKIRRDTLPNSAFDFSGELVAAYSARTRIFLDSVLAHMIMQNHMDNCSEACKILNRG